MSYSFEHLTEGVGIAAIENIAGSNNLYTLGTPDDYFVVDSGSAFEADGFVETFEKAGFLPGKCRALIITHGHEDHFGGAARLSAWFRAPVWAHVAAAPQIEDHWGLYAGLSSLAWDDEPDSWSQFKKTAGDEVRVERLLREGDRIEVPEAGTFEVLHIPGHERGLIALHEPSKRVALVGDLIQGGMDAFGNWLGLIPDPARQRRSLARIRELEPTWLLKGHRCPRSGKDPCTDLEASMERAEALAGSVEETLGQRERVTLVEATREAFKRVLDMDADNPPPYAVTTIYGFLAELGRKGKAEMDDDWNWSAL